MFGPSALKGSCATVMLIDSCHENLTVFCISMQYDIRPFFGIIVAKHVGCPRALNNCSHFALVVLMLRAREILLLRQGAINAILPE